MATLRPGAETVVLEYQTASGKKPYRDWVRDLRDRQAAGIIRERINRVRLGQFGAQRPVGDKVWELKIFFGPGYRIYYLLARTQVVVLLCGGDKGSQSKDIEKAREFAADYWRRST